MYCGLFTGAATPEKDSCHSEKSFSSVDDTDQDSDFLPGSASDSSEDIPTDVEDNKNPKRHLPQSSSSHLLQSTSPKGTRNEIISLAEKSSPIIVAKTRNTDKRTWDKKFPCIFCKNFVTKLPRNFLQVHSEEKEVLLWKSLPPKDPKRVELLNKLRNCGTFIHNSKVLKQGTGTIIPKRRKAEPLSPSKLVPCSSCNQFYTRRVLYRHKKHARQKIT